MTEHQFSDAHIDRARIDGGFSFALAAFLLGIGLLAILDRVGMPDDMLRAGLLALLFCGLVVVSVWLRTMRIAAFYAAGRVIPSVYAGMVAAGLGFALFLPLLPPLGGLGFFSIFMGVGLGLLWLLFVNGPLLRQSGFYSFADVIGTRFPLPIIRIPMVLLVAFCSGCVALAGFEIAVHHLSIALSLDRGTSAGLIGLMIIVLLVPAGLSGVIWASVAAIIVTVVATVLPLLMGLITGQPQTIPVLGNPRLWAHAVADIATVTGADTGLGLQMSVVIAFALGVPVLAPLFNGMIATRSAGSAWRSGLTGAFWLVGGGILLAATLGSAALTLEHDTVGKLPANLPSFLVNAAEGGSLTICGQNTANRTILAEACALRTGSGKGLRLSDIAIRGDDLLSSLPALRGSEPTLARLASAFAILLGVGLAAAGLQSFITSLGHDLAHPARRQLGPVSRRLAVARALAIGFVLIAGFRLAGQSVDARFLLVLPVMLSAGLLAPPLALTFMPRGTPLGALASLCVASFVMVHFFAMYKAPLHLAEFATDAVFAAADGFVVALFIAFLPKWTPLEAAPAQPAPVVAQQEIAPVPEEASVIEAFEAQAYAEEPPAEEPSAEAPYAEQPYVDESSEGEVISRSPPEDSLDVP
ncbi:MAG: hypothetical protein ABSC72_03090 [Methylovirgula sp.]